ncbi:MAG: segregation/condensation protein A [Patescibacteria group bacterium]
MYAVKVGQFEGPLDLLLELIERHKLSINDISLAQITDQYLEHLKQLDGFPIEEVALFITIASTLILIKSHSLIPSMELTPEEEENIEELEERLRIYRQIKTLSIHIKQIFYKNPVFAREGFKNITIGFIEPKGISVDNLYVIFKNVIDRLPKENCLPEVKVKKIISLEEKIKELAGRIQGQLELSFREFATSRADMKDKKIEMIISFLAMLEMIKREIIIVNQIELFGEINICRYE